MIYEFAIDPALAVAWGKDRRDFKYYYEKFGLGQSRLMSEFPKLKKWRLLFRQAAQGAQELEEERITALFNLLVESLIRREGCRYDGNISWLENAEIEHGRCPFHAILASENPRHYAHILTSERISSHPLWKLEEQETCRRIAAEMASLVASMLANCNEVHFIDPHFGPENRRHRRPLAAFLREIVKDRNIRTPIKCVMVHTSAKAPAGFFRDECEAELPRIVPAGLSIILRRWREKVHGPKLHERYILTDIGGVKVGPGLDEGKEGEKFEVILLKKKMFEKQWNDYVKCPAFDLAEPPIEISGNA